jgi:hypothetical protein
VQPHDLILTHHHTAHQLHGIFRGADPAEQRLHLAEPALAVEALGVIGDLTQRLDIGGDPGQPMGGMLLALERYVVDLAARGELGGEGLDGPAAQFGGRLSDLV